MRIEENQTVLKEAIEDGSLESTLGDTSSHPSAIPDERKSHMVASHDGVQIGRTPWKIDVSRDYLSGDLVPPQVIRDIMEPGIRERCTLSWKSVHALCLNIDEWIDWQRTLIKVIIMKSQFNYNVDAIDYYTISLYEEAGIYYWDFWHPLRILFLLRPNSPSFASESFEQLVAKCPAPPQPYWGNIPWIDDRDYQTWVINKIHDLIEFQAELYCLKTLLETDPISAFQWSIRGTTESELGRKEAGASQVELPVLTPEPEATGDVAAAPPEAAPASPKQKPSGRGGRPHAGDPKEDKRLHGIWKLGQYRTLAEMARDLSMKPKDLKHAVDRARKK